ncbi:MAG: queuosine precursor transporter [Pyrinomonadaceae bacterium]|nr:queuosine precursor transporter [Blastocatellia bacterium]MCW5958180.1 queuosine precursor transporter [Pyrinomonadaceae bacterium]
MESNRTYKYYDLLMAAFVAVLLCSNLIGVHKVSHINLPFYGEYIYGAGVLFFPISYLFGDILTEVYGYKRSRKVIWAGFGALIFASLMAFVVSSLPAAKTMSVEQQSAVNLIFGQTPRIVAASLLAFWIGEFVNSFVLAKLKLFSSGRFLWIRTIGSTIMGEIADSLVFYPVAFFGTWSNEQLISVMIGNYIIKVLWEVIATPFTYLIVGFLKRAEHEDYYDRDTDFNPFSLET